MLDITPENKAEWIVINNNLQRRRGNHVSWVIRRGIVLVGGSGSDLADVVDIYNQKIEKDVFQLARTIE